MPALLGVNIAIIQSNQVLLTKRKDFEVWCLPGGGIEEGESAAQAAVREAYEETGIEVQLIRLVGLYSRPQWGSGGHSVLFAAKPVSGELRPQPGEVIEVRYFASHELPENMPWWHHQPILDALNGVGGSVAWLQNTILPFEQEMTREELYERRDQSGLPRQQFFSQYFRRSEAEFEKLEVGEEVHASQK